MIDVLAKIETERLHRGWSEYALAEKSNIAQSTISSWYKKDMLPSLSSLEKICHAFDVSMSYFFAESQEISLTDEQSLLLEKWSLLTAEQKAVLLSLFDVI